MRDQRGPGLSLFRVAGGLLRQVGRVQLQDHVAGRPRGPAFRLGRAASTACLTLPCSRSNSLALLHDALSSRITMRVPRSTSLALVSCMSTMLLPRTRPSLTITAVDTMLRTSFCAVPAFMRVLPVTNSGPTGTSIG